METIYENRYLNLSFDTDRSLLALIWQPETINMYTADYKEQTNVIRDTFIEHRAARLLADTRKLNFPITPELQAWTNEHLTYVLQQNGLERTAVIMSEDFISQLAIEQIADDVEADQRSDYRFFSDYNEALDWLNA